MSAFTAPSSLSTLRSACAAVGLESFSEPQLIRLGENAVWRLPKLNVIARVARSDDRYAQAERGVAMARWMAQHQVPVAAPLEEIDNPHRTEDGRVVTWWQEVEQARPASPAQLGAALAALHRMPAPEHVELPRAATVDKAEARLRVVDLDEEDRVALLELAGRFQAEYAALSYDLAETVVHGDAHAANLMATPAGGLGWVDLDGVAWGQPEWDLVLTAIEYECGWVSDAQYSEFVDAYGYDVTSSAAYPVLRGIRLLRMTSWLAQLPGAVERREVVRRVRDLRTGASILGWRAF
ncbi:phosphotransferase family protein [Nocardiopsis terrae]|uniref:phosphotransferase family protein n=1 Tax=Streptomyces sp. NPDC057554 TaxID=3350538 RepID=UPI00367DB2E9